MVCSEDPDLKCGGGWLNSVYSIVDFCDFKCYLNNYPDLKAQFGDDVDKAKNHWYQDGQREGRDCSCDNDGATYRCPDKPPKDCRSRGGYRPNDKCK